jgi:heme-degrading monooxygenase HmoA
MIARTWRARASADGAETYRRHFIESVLPALRSVDGHRGADLLRHDRADGDVVELEVVTLWESMDAVRRFSVPDVAVAVAVVEPEAKAALGDFDTTVSCQTVVVDTATGAPR